MGAARAPPVRRRRRPRREAAPLGGSSAGGSRLWARLCPQGGTRSGPLRWLRPPAEPPAEALQPPKLAPARAERPPPQVRPVSPPAPGLLLRGLRSKTRNLKGFSQFSLQKNQPAEDQVQGAYTGKAALPFKATRHLFMLTK